MRLVRLGPAGSEIPAVLDGGAVLDLRPVASEIDGDFLSGGGVGAAQEALRAGVLKPLVGADAMRVGPPIARPGAIVCIGMNYAAHAAESGARSPESPVVFLKAPNTIAGPDDDVEIPRGSAKTDWEVELGVVIGSHTHYLDSPDESDAHIAGYVLANDVSERDFQITVSGGQWSKGKCAPGFSPIGPWLATADEVDPRSLRLRSWVNGQPRQDSNTSDMIFDVRYLVWHLSQYLALDPGDLVLTGTPQGVALSGRFPFLRAGDSVDVEIDGLGHATQHFTAYRPVQG